MDCLRGVWRLVALFVVALALAGCAAEPGGPQPSSAETGGETAGSAAAAANPGADCPVTTPVTATPPDSQFRSPLPTGAYFVSADRGIWTAVAAWGLGSRKVGWIKPEGSTLTVLGRRLDGDAAPLWADISERSVGDFQSSRVIIPSAGCWEIEARAKDSLLRFVFFVPQRPDSGGASSCENIGEVVRLDRLVVTGRVESSTVDASGRWAWQSVRVTRNLYPYSWYREHASVGRMLTLLQDTARESPRAEGAEYLLVLHSDPWPWQVTCPQQTVAAVDQKQDSARVLPLAPDQTLWEGTTLPEIENQIALAYRSSRG